MEIWLKVGAPAPAPAADMMPIGVLTKSPARLVFNPEDFNKPLWLKGRRQNHPGQSGPFSPVQSTVIS